MRTATILEQYSFFRDAPRRLREEILAHAQTVHMEPGLCVLTAGAPCHQLALVGQGNVRVFITSESGREVTLYTVGPGETCPTNMLCVLIGLSSPAAAQTETAVEAALLPRQAFQRWVADAGVVRQFVFHALAERLVDVLALLEQVTFARLDRRLAAFLLRRFATATPDADTRTLYLTHERMALELGSAREVVSRLLKEFERQGAVKLGRGYVTLADPTVLRQLASDYGTGSGAGTPPGSSPIHPWP
jgi:CRP/FNR family transcriptional regulator